MGTPSVANLLQIPGRLSFGPTSLSTAYPHGGTALATMCEVTVRPLRPPFLVTAWEWGGVSATVIDGGQEIILDATLREWDADALGRMFPCYATGAQGGPTLEIVVNGSGQRAGADLGSSLGIVLLFTPDSPDVHPFILLRRAVPALPDTVRLALAGNKPGEVACRWIGTPTTGGKVASIGRRRDLTL